jgi:hypothetical protein
MTLREHERDIAAEREADDVRRLLPERLEHRDE